MSMIPEKKQSSPEVRKEQLPSTPKIKELEQKLNDVNGAIKETKDKIDTIEKTIDRKLLQELEIYNDVILSLKDKGVRIEDIDRGDKSTFNVGGFGKYQTIEVDIKGNPFDKKISNPGFKTLQEGVIRLTKNKNILKKWRGKEALLIKNMNTIIHKIEESETLKKKFIKLNTIKIDINSQVEELKASENAPKLFNAILNTYKLANFHFSYGSNPDQCNQVNNLRTVFPRIRERSFERDMYIDSPNQISIKNLREYDGWGYDRRETFRAGEQVTIEKRGQDFYLINHKNDQISAGFDRPSYGEKAFEEKKLSGKEVVKILSDLGKIQHIFEQWKKQKQIEEKKQIETLQKQKEQEDNEYRLDKELKKIK